MIKMKSKGECNTFEPQAWRRNVCKNCFRTEPEHKATEASGGAPQEDPSKLKDKSKQLKAKEPLSDKKPDLKSKSEAKDAKPDPKDSKDTKSDSKTGGQAKAKVPAEEEEMDKKPGLKREPGKLLNRFGDRFDKFNKPAESPPGKPTWARPQLRSVKERRDSLKKDEEAEKDSAKKDKPLLGAAAKKDKELDKNKDSLKKDEPKSPAKPEDNKDKKGKTDAKDKPLKDKLKVVREKDIKESETKVKDTDVKTDIKDKDVKDKDTKDKDVKDKDKQKDTKGKLLVLKEKGKDKEKDKPKEADKDKDETKTIKAKEKATKEKEIEEKKEEKKEKKEKKEEEKKEKKERKEEKKEKKKKSKLEKDLSVEEESSEESIVKKKPPETAAKPKPGRRSAPFEKPKEEKEEKEERELQSGKQDTDKNTAEEAGASSQQPQQVEPKIAKEQQPQPPTVSDAASIATDAPQEVTPVQTPATEEASVDFTIQLSASPQVTEADVVNGDVTVAKDDVTVTSGDVTVANDDVTVTRDAVTLVAEDSAVDAASPIPDEDSGDQTAEFTMTLPSSEESQDNSFRADSSPTEGQPELSITINEPERQDSLQESTELESQQQVHQGEEKAQQGEEKAQQGEEKALQAEEKVQQAEEKVQQAEEKVQQAEEKVQQAEEKVQQAEEQVQQGEELAQQGEQQAQQGEEQVQQPEQVQQGEESPQVQHGLIRILDAETVELEEQQELERLREVEREQEIHARQQQEFLQQQELRQPEPEKTPELVESQTIQLGSYEDEGPKEEEKEKSEPRFHQSVVLNVNGVHVITDGEDAPVVPPPRVDSEYEPPSSTELLTQVSSSGVDTSPTSESEGQGVRQFHLLRQRTRHRPRVHSGEWERRTSMEEGDMPSREEAMMEGTRMLIENLREKILLLEEKIDRLDREKGALGDLLAVRKAEFNDSEVSFHDKIESLEDHCKRIESENTRLLNRIKMPESERNSLRDQENEICDLKKTIEELENQIGDMHNENNHLRQEIGDLHVEMEELHDQFRDEESLEFRELQKELEATAKNCRILQFKLRKVERKNEQLEHERLSYEDKFRQLESRPRSGGGDEGYQVRELEEELRMAKEVSVRLHDELEMLEERRIKTEEELDRTQDYLRESESRRSALQAEADALMSEVEALRSKSGDTLDVPKRPMLGKMGSQGSTEFDMEQVMRDLSDSLERENDLKEQLKFAEEENKTLRKKVSEIEDENDALNIQINKMTSTGKTGKYAKHRADRKLAERKSESSDDEDAGELRLQLEIMDNEMKVMRRKMSELETENENLLEEIKYLQGKLSKSAKTEPEEDDRPIEERITGLTQHIGELKMKLLQQDYQVEPLSPEVAKKAILKKSKSLDDSSCSLELTKQLDITQRDTQALRDRVLQLKTANENLLAENRRLMGSKSPSGGLVPAITADDAALKEQFLKRIECLERLLQEERKKNEMNEKKAEVQDGATSSLTDDAKLYQRQIELLQKELSLTQQQLREANDVITDLRSRFTKVEEARTSTSKQFNDVAKQLEDERKKRLEVEKTLDEEREEWKKKEDDGGAEGVRRLSAGSLSDKPPASWRWEKQDLEKQVKELTKRAEELDKQLKRKLVRSGSLTEDDKQKDEKTKERIDALVSENEKLKEKLAETEKRIQEMIESNALRESQWASDREIMEADKIAAQKEVQQQIEIIRMKDEIISGKEDILRQKEQAIVERDDAIKQKDELVAHKEQMLMEKEQTFKEKADQFSRSEELILSKDHQILELETKMKFMDETIRQRDDRLNEKDFAIEKLNRFLSEKESETKDLDQSIRIVMKKLESKDAEMLEIKKLADDLTDDKRTLEEKVRDLDEAKRKVERDRDKETAALVIQREKLENQLEYIMREKKCADDEIRLLRHTLNERDEDWAKTKQRYETELGKKQEKIHSLEVLQSSRDNDVIQNIVTEKQTLLKDKQRLEDIVKKLRAELEKSRNAHVTEVNNIKRTYTEYKKKLETRTRDCIKLQKEIARLREQLAKRGADHSEVAGVMSPISPFSPTIRSPTILSPGTLSPTSFSSSSAVRPPDLAGALERQELIFKAEKVGIEELYEQKLRLVTDQLAQAKAEIATMKQENNTQKELLLGGSKTLSEVKSKYDIDRNAWNEERNALERSKVQSENAQKKIDELESNLDKLRIRLKHEESHRAELEGYLQIKNKEVELLRKLKQSEGSSVDQASALNETKVMVEEAEKRLRQAEQGREREQQEIFLKLEQLRADWNREKRDMIDKNSKLEEKAKQLAPLQRTLIDLQYKLHSYRETWLRERSELQRQLDEAQRCQLEEKQKYVDLLTESKKIKAPKPSPTIERSQSSMDDYRVQSTDLNAAKEGTSGVSTRHKTSTVIALTRQMSSPNAPTPNAGSMDPSHISKSPQNQSHPEVPLRKGRTTTAPPAFRRSLSSSEAEVQMALNQQIMKERQEQKRVEFLTPSGALGSSGGSTSSWNRASPQPPEEDQLHPKPPLPHSHRRSDDGEDGDRSSFRSRSGPRRANSTSQDPGNYDTASLERPSRSIHSNRNSMYSSGTQSAYTSRDASPEKGRPRFGKSPYPAPPPSFLITPPRSPRHFNPSPHCSILTSENMMKLYEKLGNIERAEDGPEPGAGMSVTQSAAIAKERTGAVRVLMKSMSMDSYAEDVPLRDQQESLPERMSFIEIIRNSETYEDAPLSQTLPASIRIGELVITPGIEALSKTFSPTVYRSKVVLSPKTQRRKFFDEYPADAETFALQELERVATAQQRELERSSRSKAKRTGSKHRDKSTDSVASVTSVDSVTRRERSISEKASAFFTAVKEKRKKFGNKRSGSVEDSNLGGHIARAGMTALRPAAPATPEPPVPQELPAKDKRRFFHRRAASIDLTTLFRSRESSRDRSSNRK